MTISGVALFLIGVALALAGLGHYLSLIHI